MEKILTQFAFDGKIIGCEQINSGHINRTYHVFCDTKKEYILQKISRAAFHEPEKLMQNMRAVTHHLQKKLDEGQKTLELTPTKNGAYCWTDEEGECWRAYEYVSGGICLDAPRSNSDCYEAALAFGRFQNALTDFPAETLHETIAHFHDTPDRLRKLHEAAERDAAGRAASVQKELEFLFSREEKFGELCRLLSMAELPLRVTHNDTKLNNVLLDPDTGKSLCVLDLDTVMPGLAAYDFGDLVRFSAATAAEDELDCSKMHMDIERYRVLLRGFLDGCGRLFTEKEIETLPFGAWTITGELAARFLTDYLDGDVYFAVH
ncbi:MAG: aminoglycoside phosphotransferase family protein, partial [Oscillospiraceae bacterium]|nr:aminoglycoside phosphotransferase family protein [Oscillospiraceae bacterium]